MVRTPGFTKRAPRTDLRKPAVLINAAGEELGVFVLDVSGSGFRLKVEGAVGIGEFVTLRVDREDVPAQIRWALGDEAGGTFLEPVDLKIL